MTNGKVDVARRRLVAPMTEQFADQWQVLTRHDDMARRRLPFPVENFRLTRLPALTGHDSPHEPVE